MILYYDWAAGRPIDPEVEAVPFETSNGDAPCYRHRDGLLIFPGRETHSTSDEYADGDPYRVEENLDSTFHQTRLKWTLKLVETALAKNERHPRILDVGCGEGHLTAALQRDFPTAQMAALDCSLAAIRTATARYPGIQFAVADACVPPYPPQTFDIVICNNLWEHVPDPLTLLSGLSRVIRPDGHLIISTPGRYRLDNLLRLIRGRPVAFMSNLHVTEYSPGQVAEQLRFGGFSLVRTASERSPGPAVSGVSSAVARFILLPALRLALRPLSLEDGLETTVFFLARKSNF